MNPLTLLAQLFILVAMMAVGYLSIRKGFLHSEGQHEISTLVVRVMNPLLMISSVTGEADSKIRSVIGQNVLAVIAYFAFVIIAGSVYFHIRKADVHLKRTHQIMICFSNIGFFGIPLVRGLFGDRYIILLVFYIVGFNLIAYSYGILLAGSLQEGKVELSPKRMINAGTVSGVIAILIFVSGVHVPGPVVTFCKYMGDACVPLSMMVIGATLAETDLREVFTDRENYIFTVVKMLIVPFIGIMLFKFLPFADEVRRIANVVLCMPVAALSGMLCEEYGGSGAECNRCTALSTISCMITLPLLSIFM